MDVRKTIGWNLRRLRVERDLSQERLALKSGLDRAYLGRIERGTENVTVSTLEAVTTAMDVHVSVLFEAVPNDTQPPAPLKAGRKPKNT